MPQDFGVMVATHEDLASGHEVRATEVIEGCAIENLRTPLNLRQDQVLAGILQNLSNKETAAKLNISERTVKFHVSALLQKFGVRGRADLMLESVNILPPEAVHRREPKIPCNSTSIGVKGIQQILAALTRNSMP